MSADWPRSLHTLYTPDQVRAILHRERLRADRERGQVSVAVFELGGMPRTARVLQRWRYRRLARILLQRARVTDEVGWMSTRQLCAVLPGTGSFGAYCFADGVRHMAGRRGLNASYTIYVYPQEGDDLRGTPQRAKEPAARETATHSAFRADPVALPDPLERRGVLSPVTAEVTRREDDPRAEAFALAGVEPRPLHRLLCRPLPAWKRAMDVVGASLGLAVGAPVMAAAAVMIRLSSPGPVLFKQPRAGLGGEEFTIFKFRTMVPDAERLKASLRPRSEQDGPAFKMNADPRVTRVGKFLRSTSLDELPQLWNVLVGNMSLVGPRPLPIDESDGCRGWQRRRLDVMPGLTCIWQVRGRSRVRFDDWMRMDMEYIRNRSFFHDLKILLLTLPAVILRRGAH